jgi:glutaconate CoA-transferase, subunit A
MMGKLAINKVKSLEETLQYVSNGAVIGFGGLIYWRRPIQVIRAIIKHGFRDLTAVSFVGSLEIDMLAAAGCISKVHANLVGLQAFGIAPNFRQKVEKGEITFVEHSEGSIILALQAAGMQVPFLPTKALLGSDLIQVNAWKNFNCPLTNELLTAVPALKLDVAFIHVPRTDEKGNAHLEGVLGMDNELVLAADRVVLTTEEIVPTRDIMKENCKTRIFSHLVDAVVKMPRGCHPTSCLPFYRLDALKMLEYAENASDPKWMRGFLAEGGAQ